MSQQALGLIEMHGFTGITEAADAAVKAASVTLSGYEKIEGGLVSIRLLGDVGAVKAAVEAGASAGGRVGQLVAQHVIANPHENLVACFFNNGSHGALATVQLQEADLGSLSVTQLRRLARATEGLGIQGREISHANREQLITEIRKAREGDTTA